VARNALLPDTDHDTLPDWWEQRYFPYIGANPEDDPDKDTLSNSAEFKTGTNPVDAQSVLKLTPKRGEGGGVVVEWSSVANRVYTLERAPGPSPVPGSFVPFRTGIKATPPSNSEADPEAGTGKDFFYRVRLEE
jgi:hypothetical protein